MLLMRCTLDEEGWEVIGPPAIPLYSDLFRSARPGHGYSTHSHSQRLYFCDRFSGGIRRLHRIIYGYWVWVVGCLLRLDDVGIKLLPDPFGRRMVLFFCIQTVFLPSLETNQDSSCTTRTRGRTPSSRSGRIAISQSSPT